MEENSRPVVIFDGYCNLCNSSVDFILKRDLKKQFLFTANQHEAGKQILTEQGKNPEDVHTIYLLENGQLYEKSTAALRIARQLRFPWNLLYTGMIFPRFIRNPIYDFIARNRYRWLGKRDTCRLPTAEERARFLP